MSLKKSKNKGERNDDMLSAENGIMIMLKKIR